MYWEAQGDVTREAVLDFRLRIIRELRRQVVRKVPAEAVGTRRYRFRPVRDRWPNQYTLYLIIGDGPDAQKRFDRLARWAP